MANRDFYRNNGTLPEAMSELITFVYSNLMEGKRIPSYAEIVSGNDYLEWRQYIIPGHNSGGDDPEKWHKDKGAAQPMSEDLCYATIWVMYNLGKNPFATSPKLPYIRAPRA
jgi:hypothetical protein